MIKVRRNQKHKIDFVFLLVLIVLFALTSLLIVSLGANQYRKITGNMSSNYEERTCISYLEEKLHQNDSYSAISSDTLYDSDGNGIQTLKLTNSINGQTYTTYIYCFDGYIHEILTTEGSDVSLSSGQKIAEAKALSFTDLNESLMKISVTKKDGSKTSIYSHKRTQ